MPTLTKFAYASDPPDPAWKAQYATLVDFYSKNSHTNKPAKEDPGFATWMHRQRKYARAGNLHPEKVRLLKTLGVNLTATKRKITKMGNWMRLYDCLKAALKATGKVPSRKENSELAQWCVTQRARKRGTSKKGPLTAEQEQLLNDINFDWDPGTF